MRIPNECKGCDYHKVIHSIRTYHFCELLNKSFSGGEPLRFFCDKISNHNSTYCNKTNRGD